MATAKKITVLQVLLGKLETKLESEQKTILGLGEGSLEHFNQSLIICSVKAKIESTKDYLKQLEENQKTKTDEKR